MMTQFEYQVFLSLIDCHGLDGCMLVRCAPKRACQGLIDTGAEHFGAGQYRRTTSRR